MLTPQQRKNEFDDFARFFKLWYGDDWVLKLFARYRITPDRLWNASLTKRAPTFKLLEELRAVRAELEAFARESLAGRCRPTRDRADRW